MKFRRSGTTRTQPGCRAPRALLVLSPAIDRQASAKVVTTRGSSGAGHDAEIGTLPTAACNGPSRAAV
jgi:N-acetyl-gamma-glutamylphosphate reductase